MKKLNQTGAAHLVAILIVVVLGIVGFTGWKVYDSNQKTKKSLDNASSNNAAIVEKKKSPPEETTVKYESKDLGFSFSYPKDWGDATIQAGTFISPATGNYKQITFAKQGKVTINVVLGAAQSPLDGCGLEDPIKSRQHSLYLSNGTTIGWDEKGILQLFTGQGVEGGGSKVFTYGYTPGDGTPGYDVIEKNSKVVLYYDYDKTPTKAVSGDSAVCGEITQAKADEANAFSKIVHYAANYSNAKVKGVNANYDAREKLETTVRDQVTSALNTLK